LCLLYLGSWILSLAEMMRPYLLDVGRLLRLRLAGRAPTGIDRVTIEYVRHYGARARAVVGAGSFGGVLTEAGSDAVFRYVSDPATAGAWRGAALMAKAVAPGQTPADVKGCLLLKTDPFGLDRPGPVARCLRRGARLVSLLYDLIPATHPEYCRPGERERHLVRTRAALTLSAGLVAISRDTLEAVTGYARDAYLRLPPALAAPLAPGLPALEPGPAPVTGPYFVTVGTIEPRKNHLLLLHLWRELASALGEGAPRLVIVGRRGWECENAVDLLERSPGVRATVIEAGACDDRELVTWLRHARALLFPSFAEGYGMPLVEALALGTPVIASDLPVFREAAGDVPDYADPLDGARWMELVLDYAAPAGAARAAQLGRLREFRVPAWAQHFGEVDAFLATFVKRES